MLVHVDFRDYSVVESLDGFDTKDFRVKAWCRECKKNSATPIGLTRFNREVGIVLKCNTCGHVHILYLSKYRREYIGFTNMKGDFIPALKDGGMPENLKNKYAKEREENRLILFKSFGYSEEDAEKRIKEMEEEDKKRRSQFAKNEEMRRAEYREKELEDKAAERKRLIAEGIIKWSKSAGCLIDTRTNTVVKL